VARAQRFAHDGVHVVAFPPLARQGGGAQSAGPPRRGEIVLFADARQTFDPQVLRRLVSRFADERVGAVSGELMLTDSTGTPMGRGAVVLLAL
jgi:hypothetical protein